MTAAAAAAKERSKYPLIPGLELGNDRINIGGGVGAKD